LILAGHASRRRDFSRETRYGEPRTESIATEPIDPAMTLPPPRVGYTLPVFATAAAIAALRWLNDPLDPLPEVTVDLLEPPERVTVPIEQVARLRPEAALAITRSDPGDNLDLTRNTPVWALVEAAISTQADPIELVGGEGIGRQVQHQNQPAIYAYARRSLLENLSPWLRPNQRIRVTLILPEGRSLATRTSNAAFGVVEGLSLLGTSGLSQPLSAPGQLEQYRQVLREKQPWFDGLVFCVGENGLDLARRMGIGGDRLVKTANWLGPMLVEAGMQGVQSILLLGYHGKLLKLAGGVFHTHHHVADARQAILTAYGAIAGLPTADTQTLFQAPTAEAALQALRQWDAERGSQGVEAVYGAIAQAIEERAAAYIQTHSTQQVRVGTALFDRDRTVFITGQTGAKLLSVLRKDGRGKRKD
jgi:cobalt-precorrin-5B (C1)-methyltransferase